MHFLYKWFGFTSRIDGLEDILEQVAHGEIEQQEAARRIRVLASRPDIPSFLLWVFRLFGAGFALLGLGLIVHNALFAIGTKQAEGTVVEMVGDEMKSPVVEFNANDRRHTFQSKMSSSPPAYSVGERVSVLYHPEQPAEAQIDSFSERWLFPLGFATTGISTFIMSFSLPKIVRTMTGAY